MSMLGVYVVLGTGIVIAFLTLIAEILWKRREKHKLLNKARRFVINISTEKELFLMNFKRIAITIAFVSCQ